MDSEEEEEERVSRKQRKGRPESEPQEEMIPNPIVKVSKINPEEIPDVPRNRLVWLVH